MISTCLARLSLLHAMIRFFRSVICFAFLREKTMFEEVEEELFVFF